MKNILMFKTEQILTSTGALTVKQGQQLVEDWIADSFVGRGLAALVATEATGTTPLPGDSISELEALNIGQLRELAQMKNVPGYRKLKREELISALKPLAPPKEPFEPVDNTKGKEPPVFKAEA